MSSQFVSVLFPTITHTIKQYVPALWSIVFPVATEIQCPIQTTSIKMPFLPKERLPQIHSVLGYFSSPSYYFPVRSPVLMACEIPGIVIGLLGLLLIERKFWAWRSAFLFFAGMNTAAIFCHNLTKAGSNAMWWAWALDVAFTGSSSYCLLLASIFQPFPIASIPGSTSPTKTIQRTEPLIAQLLFVLGVAGCFIGSILGIANPTTRFIPWTSEIIYVVLTVIGAAALFNNVVAPAIFSGKTDKGRATVTLVGKVTLMLATASILAGAAGLPLDRHICNFLNANQIVTDFNVAHVLFLGCDLAFLFLLAYATVGVVPTSAPPAKKKQ
ncbi:hypothetical protein HDU67_008414 [Dinochytrium kinnereticum]|nr:hypothetical protein HDU67_008414 [Dinochytrium kinnereticum]